MEEEHIHMQMEMNGRVNGRMEKILMVKELLSMIMERCGKVNTRMARGMAKVHTLILIRRNMLDNILMMNAMGREL